MGFNFNPFTGNLDLTGASGPLVITDTFVVNSEAEMLALVAQRGDMAVRTDLSKTFILQGDDPTQLSGWVELATPPDAVTSVNTKVGAVVLDKSDIGLSNVDNTSDLNKPISTATQDALDLKLDLAGGTMTGNIFLGTNYIAENSSLLSGLWVGPNGAGVYNKNTYLDINDDFAMLQAGDGLNLDLVSGSGDIKIDALSGGTVKINSKNNTGLTEIDGAKLTINSPLTEINSNVGMTGSLSMTSTLDTATTVLSNNEIALNQNTPGIDLFLNLYTSGIVTKSVLDQASLDANYGLKSWDESSFAQYSSRTLSQSYFDGFPGKYYNFTVQNDGVSHYTDSFTPITPTSDVHLTNKKYVDDAIIASAPDLSLFLKKDGTEQLTNDWTVSSNSASSHKIKWLDQFGSTSTSLNQNELILNTLVGPIFGPTTVYSVTGLTGSQIYTKEFISPLERMTDISPGIIKLYDNTSTPILPVSPEDVVVKQYVDDSKQSIIDMVGDPFGFAGLDGNGKVPASQLPNSIMEYQGIWDASTNNPFLIDTYPVLAESIGNVYRVYVAGTQNLGHGPITFNVGDYVILNSDGIWEKSGTTDAVSSVNGMTGDVVIGIPEISGLQTALDGKFDDPTGNTTQYIRGDGTLATFPTVISDATRLITYAFNQTGATIPKFSAVYINGGHSQSDKPTITLAQGNTEANSTKTFGVTQDNIPNMSSGIVVVSGILTGVNTDQFNPTAPLGNVNGVALWLSPTTPGALTTTKPSAPDHMVFIGTITNTHQNNGSVAVKVQNGNELEELHNVKITTPTDEHILIYDPTTDPSHPVWKNQLIGNIPTIAGKLNKSGGVMTGPIEYSVTAGGFTDITTLDSGLFTLSSNNYTTESYNVALSSTSFSIQDTSPGISSNIQITGSGVHIEDNISMGSGILGGGVLLCTDGLTGNMLSFDVTGCKLMDNTTNPLLPANPENVVVRQYVDDNFANNKLSNLTAPTAINQSLIPFGDTTFSLGSLDYFWQTTYTDSLYVDSIVSRFGTGSVGKFYNYDGFQFRLFSNYNAYITLRANANSMITGYILTLPVTQGSANSTLLNDGGGNLSWVTGQFISATAGENLTAGDAVYISKGNAAGDTGRTAGQVYKLDATNDARMEYIGIVKTTVLSSATASIQVSGTITFGSTMTSGMPVFASTSTPGSYTQTAASTVGLWSINLGTAKDATTLIINPGLASSAIKISNNSQSLANLVTNTATSFSPTITVDVILCNAASGAQTINLPTAVGYAGKIIDIKKTDSTTNSITIDANASETIDGALTQTLALQYDAMRIISDGSNWSILA